MKKETKENAASVSVENIYKLDGRVPLKKAIPFGLQHVLAMFVANLAPVLIVCSAAVVRGTGENLTSAEITRLLQCAMFAGRDRHLHAAVSHLEDWFQAAHRHGRQLHLPWQPADHLHQPAAGYEGMIGAVILGGIFEGLVGLSAKYWKRFLTPVVSACVVIAHRTVPAVGGHGFLGRRQRRGGFRSLVSPAGGYADADRLSAGPLSFKRHL